MIETHPNPPRPVSLITLLAIFALFAVVFVVVRRYYHPATQPAFVAQAENFPVKDESAVWKASRDSRREELIKLREAQAKQATTYGWVDQKAGVVQLPIERAMELTAQRYGKK